MAPTAGQDLSTEAVEFDSKKELRKLCGVSSDAVARLVIAQVHNMQKREVAEADFL
jgi:hypothetical protein